MDAQSRRRKWVGKVGWTLLTLFIIFVVLLGLLDLPLRFAILLSFGWLSYAHNVVPRLSFNAEIAANAGIALILATAGLHRTLVWWGRQQSGEGARWRFVSTLKITLMVLLLFATSIAATGIVHQVGWLFRAEELTYDASRGLMTRELSNLKQVALGLRLYVDDFEGKLPRDLDALVPDYLPDGRLLFSTIERGEPPERILYFPDNQASDPAHTIILAGPRASASGKRVVAQRDAAAQIVKEKEFQQMLRQQTPPAAISSLHP